MGKINDLYNNFSKKYLTSIYKNEFSDYDDFIDTFDTDLNEELEYLKLTDKRIGIKTIILENLEEYVEDKLEHNLQECIGHIFFCEECKIYFYSEESECAICSNCNEPVYH